MIWYFTNRKHLVIIMQNVFLLANMSSFPVEEKKPDLIPVTFFLSEYINTEEQVKKADKHGRMRTQTWTWTQTISQYSCIYTTLIFICNYNVVFAAVFASKLLLLLLSIKKVQGRRIHYHSTEWHRPQSQARVYYDPKFAYYAFEHFPSILPISHDFMIFRYALCF